MRSRVTALSAALATVLVMLAPTSAQADEPPISSTGQNLPALTGTASYQAGRGLAAQIRAYRASGNWNADRNRIAAAATAFLDAWLTSCRTEADCRPAVVFDIDETLLTSYPVFNSHDFDPTSAQRAAAQSRCQQGLITAVAVLYAHARELGVETFIITGRSERSRRSTTACLRKRGITDWTRLVMRSNAQLAASAADYKAAQRKGLEGEGYDIAFSIGDQFSDVAGGHFAHGYVLPNPMTYIA